MTRLLLHSCLFSSGFLNAIAWQKHHQHTYSLAMNSPSLITPNQTWHIFALASLQIKVLTMYALILKCMFSHSAPCHNVQKVFCAALFVSKQLWFITLGGAPVFLGWLLQETVLPSVLHGRDLRPLRWTCLLCS